MALSNHINNREFDKFTTNTSGDTAVRVVGDIEVVNDQDVVPNQPGLDTTLSLTTTAVEGRVGGASLANRQYVAMQATTNGVKWGYTTSCPFDLFKNQFIAIPAGPLTIVYFKASSGTATVVIGES